MSTHVVQSTRTPKPQHPISSEEPSRVPKAAILAMPDSAYMNDVQLAFFRRRLLETRDEILLRQSEARQHLHESTSFADPADRASAEEEHWLLLRLREREVTLLRKIDDALRRLHDRSYGYCLKSGEPIGLPRLLARPTAAVCVHIKDIDERVESRSLFR